MCLGTQNPLQNHLQKGLEHNKQIHSRFTALDLFDDQLVDLLATGPFSESKAAPNIVVDPSYLEVAG